MRGWTSDLILGMRLAVGGGRSSVTRFVLSTVGVGVAVVVLLVGASVGTIVTQQDQRDDADTVRSTEPVDGVDPLYVARSISQFQGESIELAFVHAQGENPPLPPGIDEVPAPGEMVASQALVGLLGSPDGDLLRPRLPQELVGTIGREMVPEPGDLIAYVGADAELIGAPEAERVYEFGAQYESSPPAVEAMLLVNLGAVILLVPVFIFVASASRIAGAERDRRLSALRLVGVGAAQVRRIAAAETAISAFAGLVVGSAAFLVLRAFAEDIELLGLRVYREDVVPNPVLVLVIVVAIPALAVLTALVALRRTIIEPLGVVRRVKPVRRQVWWRLLLVAAGVALLLTGGGGSRGSDQWAIALSAGTALLLIGVPVLLPWLVEGIAGRISGGPSSWQLAVRRLQLDSGTSARVVGGVVVVLAGAIALQTTLTSVEDDMGITAAAAGQPPEPVIEVKLVDHDIADEALAEVRAVPAVREAYLLRGVAAFEPGASEGSGTQIVVLDCAAMRAAAGVEECADGDVLTVPDGRSVPRPGTELEFRQYEYSDEPTEESATFERLGTWTVPNRMREVDGNAELDEMVAFADLIATPGAFASLPPAVYTSLRVDAGNPTSDQLEQLRNSVGEFGWRAYVYSYNTVEDLRADQAVFLAVRNALYAASVFILLLAGVSLLVLALEHIRERRRALAMLVASGVPRGVLARSLLWQVVLPLGIGVVVAVGTGIGLGAMIVRISEERVVVDWLGVGLLSAGAALLSVLVTAMTLPFLRGATRLTSLRTE
ncbi:FtsX-like permease family protein [Actinophytocola xanthii]|uniref:ABC3 transporter permease C-terminal domain-containing protein n=1 Tax=Actinophytocola xanthii TaxID=1912961 RepID=A0A1Q8CN03_9PSEU|nr:FtsX-like permease family protein [Actinophytocola xanthii]OLF15739.1 hypothetical protein BU204_20240 [Actinophytocola xanthii]